MKAQDVRLTHSYRQATKALQPHGGNYGKSNKWLEKSHFDYLL